MIFNAIYRLVQLGPKFIQQKVAFTLLKPMSIAALALLLVSHVNAQVDRASGPANATVVLVSPLVSASPPYKVTPLEEAFMTQLKRSMPETNFTFEYIKAETSSKEKMAELPKLIRAKNPQLIYTWGTPTTIAVTGSIVSNSSDYIRDIPVVFAQVADPVRAKIVEDNKRPGRNVTGASHLAPLVLQLNAIRNYKPFTKLGIVYNPKEPNAQFLVEDLTAECLKQKITLLVESVGLDASLAPDPTTIASRIEKLKQAGAEWLYVGPDTFISSTQRKVVIDAAIANQLPVFSALETPVREAGALYGLYSPRQNVGRFVAFKARQILTGSKPETIPVETLQKFSLLVNMKSAAIYQLYPPLSLLNVADVVENKPETTKVAVTPAPAPATVTTTLPNTSTLKN